MMIHNPCIITARLLPGVKVGNHFISIAYDKINSEGRQVYRYYIDGPGLEYENNDLRSGCCGGSLQQGLANLLAFLTACAESIRYARHSGRPGENAGLFPQDVAEFADDHADELSMLEYELTENENIIEE